MQKDGIIMIIPGNGCAPIEECNWYTWLQIELINIFPTFEIIAKTMPDPNKARESFWIPFIKKEIENYKIKILIGHSSGAIALMRLIENEKVDVCILVSGCVDDQGELSERISGYYPKQPNSDIIRPWLWNNMIENSKIIVHLGSKNDPFIPIEQMREIRDNLKLDSDSYYEFDKLGHFMFSKFNELLEICIKKIQICIEKSKI